MKWQQREIDLNQLDDFNKTLAQMVKEGNTSVPNIRCVYLTKEDKVIHMLTAFEWLDAAVPPINITRLYIYQLFE